MTRRLAQAGVAFEKKNPITTLLKNAETGEIREDILGEKIMSAIVEIKVPVDRAEEVIRMVHEVEKQVDTVVVLGVGVRCDENGDDDIVLPMLERLGYHPQRAKTNTGLGRITNKDAQVQRQPEAVSASTR